MSIAVDNENWDIYGDVSGNLAMTDTNTGVLQDVATALQMWCQEGNYVGDNIFDIDQGLPYYRKILGNNSTYNITLLMEGVAKSVQGVANCHIYLNRLVRNRKLTGVVVVQLNTGETGYVAI